MESSLTSAGSHSTGLDVVIVGAGIGGLSAAVFLRQQGHNVTLLEQSRFANELGAAVHLAPNATGLLTRMGLDAQATGANPALRMTQYLPDGKVMFSIDLEQGAKMWAHKWLLAHRVRLHERLKEMATCEQGKGRPAILKTSSRVMDLQTSGIVELATGEKIRADVIVGADGVHSRTRTKLPGASGVKTFGSGKSAFRFLMERQKALDDPETKQYAEIEGHLSMFFARDRRVVIYPTMNNTILNFVCIHPTSESEAKDKAGASTDWNEQGNLDKMLEVYKDFAPSLLRLLAMADEETLKVWELLDMETLPTWTEGVLACIGDAAHPFTPHQGQGAGQAIEDAASLAVVLPLGTRREDVPNRLKLYEQCRHERATTIQEYSRVAGRDLGDGPPLDSNRYIGYNFGHDEWDYTTQQFRKHMYSLNPNLYWRMPTAFGPMPGPRQTVTGSAQDGARATFRTASIRFKTSRTLLESLFPTESIKFASPATAVEATFSMTSLKNLAWLGGRGYSHFGLYIHGVEHRSGEGEATRATYVPILFENLADPILSGREELGMPKLWCELDVASGVEDQGFDLTARWLDSRFCKMTISDLQEVSKTTGQGTPAGEVDQGQLWYKYVPATGAAESKSRGQADVEYPVFCSFEDLQRERKVTRAWKGTGNFTFDALDDQALPTLHHIVKRLEEVPVYEIMEARVEEGTGVSDVSGARRLGRGE